MATHDNYEHTHALPFPHPLTLLIFFTFLFYSFLLIPSPPPWLPFPPLLYLNAVKQLLKEEDKRLRIEGETEGETEGGLILTMHLKMKGGEEEERQQLALEWYMRLLQLKVRLTCLCICTHSCIPDLQPLKYRCRNSYSGPFLSYLGESTYCSHEL